jgi:hypothetical protein
MEIVWTFEAKKTFKKNMIYLKNHWTKKEVDNFALEAFRTIEIVQKNPHIGKYSEDYGCHILVVVKQISLFYEIENNKIILISFWDNRQEPKY